MKKIGIIDYYLSEWHANNYPAWIKKAAEKLGYDFEIAYAWAELDTSPLDGVTTEEWCEKFGIEKCSTIEELSEKSDYIMILAPTNPETHLGYAKVALKYGKNTYIDKTFAPDLKTAEEIFALGKKYNTKFFSSSALRYSDELTDLAGKMKFAAIRGGGSNAPEYIIHQVEMLVKCLGIGAESVSVKQNLDQYYATVKYADEREGTLHFAPCLDFSVIAAGEDGNSQQIIPASPFFDNLLEDVLRFFTTGEYSFDTKETLEVMKIREMFIKGI